MKDFSQIFSALDQRASGSIIVLDYTLLSGKTFTVNGNVLTEGADFTAATSNDATATSLASAINGLALLNAAAVTDTVTIHADAPGTAGNAFNLLTNATAPAATLSGATLSGGVAATFTEAMPLMTGEDEQADVECSINVTAFTGASGGLIITPQYSYDKVTYFDDTSVFTTIDSGTSLPFQQTKQMEFTGQFIRFKLVTSGVVSSADLTLFARSSAGSEGGGASGGATAAKQDTGNASLASIDGKIPTLETAGADGASNTQSNVKTSSRISGFNGATWDRLKAGITAVTATLTGWLNTLPWAIFHTTPTTRTDGQGGPLQANNVGDLHVNLNTLGAGEDQSLGGVGVFIKPVASSIYAPTEFQNLGANTTLNIKATAGNMLAAYAVNDNAAVRYLQLHKTATVPAGGAVPQWSIPIPPAAGGTPGIAGWDEADFTQMGINSTVGWAFAISTTRGTFTDSATASEHAVFANRI